MGLHASVTPVDYLQALVALQSERLEDELRRSVDEKGLRDSAGINAGVSLSGLCNLEEVADCHIEVKCSLVLPGVAEIAQRTRRA